MKETAFQIVKMTQSRTPKKKGESEKKSLRKNEAIYLPDYDFSWERYLQTEIVEKQVKQANLFALHSLFANNRLHLHLEIFNCVLI